MRIVKQLVEFAIYALAMSAGVGLCLWVLLGLLRLDRLVLAAVPLVSRDRTASVLLIPGGWPVSQRVTSSMADLPLVPGDSGPLVTQMQGALIEKGYWVGPDGADGNLNYDALAAIQAFQDNNALPLQSNCSQQCWDALRLPKAEPHADR